MSDGRLAFVARLRQATGTDHDGAIAGGDGIRSDEAFQPVDDGLATHRAEAEVRDHVTCGRVDIHEEDLEIERGAAELRRHPIGHLVREIQELGLQRR